MLAALLLLSWALGIVGDGVPLTMLDAASYPNARCLDGSQAGYYFQPASTPDASSKWVIYLNGGGECASEESCLAQTTSALGSSKYFSESVDANGWYLASDYCPYNPDFCGYNHVFDPYCSQDLHSGQRATPSPASFNLSFSGHHILANTLDHLDTTANLTLATEILLTGTSAGGLGVWMNVDYVAARYPKARVTAVTIAGFYFYATYYTGENATAPGMADFRVEAWDSTYDLYNAYVDESCREFYEKGGNSPSACMTANQSWAHVGADSFAVQSQTDQTVLTGHDCWPSNYMSQSPESAFMAQWHANMTTALAPLMRHSPLSPRSGVFAAACYIHGGFTHSSPIIEGFNYFQAVGNFYFERTPPSGYKLADDCGEMCNPTCPV